MLIEDPDRTQALLAILQAQLENLLAMAFRPVVLQQLLAIALILILSWLVPKGLRRWRQQPGSVKVLSNMEGMSLRQRGVATLYLLLAPVLALILLNFVLVLFKQQGFPHGLLEDVTTLMWLWLGYRGLVFLLFVGYGTASNPYRKWLITPAFVIFVIVQVLSVLPGSVTLVNATINLGTITITMGSLLSALLILYLFIIASWIVQRFMVHWLPSRIGAEQGVIESVATVTRYALLGLGIVVSLSLLGLDFTSLAIIAGGLSVGIGIGLQDLVSNFVSGLVLLFEQTLRPGDVVEIDNRISQVERVSLRATTLRTRTNEELIFPNSKFTSEQVKNLTRSDRSVRVIIPVGVSYKSDPEEVRELAVETALGHELVLAEPAPGLLFLGYGDSSLNFNLLVGITQPELSGLVRSDLYYMLWRVFKEHGIEIPFPQRDLNLGDGWEQLAASAQPA